MVSPFPSSFSTGTPKETNLPYAAEILSKIAGNQTIQDYVGLAQCTYHLSGSWAPGVRLSAGWTDPCNGWDGQIAWTYFENDAADQSSTRFDGQAPITLGQSGLLNPFFQQSLTTTPFFDQVGAGWTLRFNQIDFTIGRKYLVSDQFVMRPYAGLRGAWTRTDFKVKGNTGPKNLSETETEYIQKSRDHFRNRLWGIGLQGGVENSWYFLNCLAIYGQVAGSLIWGEHEQKIYERFLSSVLDTDTNERRIFMDVSNNYRDANSQMSGILDFGIGLRWEQVWCWTHSNCCDGHYGNILTALDIGWEHHIWWPQFERLRTCRSDGDIPIITQFDTQVSNLGYGGLVIRFRVDF